MITLQADHNAAAALSAVKQVTQIQDTEGNVFGVYAPGNTEEAHLDLHAWLTLDPEQVKRQKTTPEKTYTTREVLDHLHSLGK